MMANSCESKVLVVVPTYNNGDTVGDVVRGLQKFHLPILVVDDGSRDSTPMVLSRIAGIETLQNRFNEGKGAALKRALLYAKDQGFTHILTIDADGQHYPDDVPKFLRKMEENPSGIILGVRDFNKDSIPGSSKFGRSFSNFWIWAETGLHLADTQTGFRVYPVDAGLVKALACRAYDFEIEILVRSLWNGQPASQVSIDVFYPSPEERVSHFRPFKDNLRLSLIHTKLFTLSLFLRLWRCQWKLGKESSSGAKVQERKGAGFMVALLRVIGPRWAQLIMFFPLAYFFVTNKQHQQGIAHLYRKLGRGSRWRVWLSSFKNYWMFGCSLVDRFNFKSVEISKISHDFTGFEPKSIYIGAHLGDWLIASRGLNRSKQIPVGIVIDQSRTPGFMEEVKKYGLNVTIIDPMDGFGSVLAMKELIEQGGCLSFLGDRVDGQPKRYKASFLGDQAVFPTAAYEIARALSIPVHFFYCQRKSPFGPPSYQLGVVKLWDGRHPVSVETILKRYVTELERLVKTDPKHWFNFFNFWEKNAAL